MLHTNLRDLLLHEEVLPDLESEPGTLRRSTSMVVMEKDENAVAYLISAAGDSIEMKKEGFQVLVPLTFYFGGPEQLEPAIQDRIAALLGAYDPEGGATPEQPDNGRVNIHIDNVVANLTERLKPRTLRALFANDTLAKLLVPITPKDVKVYNAKGALRDENVVLGLTDPKYVGLVMNDPRQRPDDPRQDDETPFPKGWTSHTGIVVHGGIVSATVRVRG